ncbi:MAG: BatA and WFA domain-containing protein, partial [Candidatus Kapabacteria bacterium]|nr:BatA and WFA domain-containing protein [Candidatus Kapabacteria bacterium]
MNFFNPTVLFGLIAASIPLILHIINLRKLKKVEFSSLKFLKELQKTRIKRLKIKRLLLLILRTLAIASIVIAFARPTIDSPLPLLSNYSTTSTVILLDNSASMNISDAHGNRFNQAKNEVRRILTTRKEGDETAIIPLSTTANSSIFGNILSRNSEYVRAELDNMPLGYSVADLDRGIRSAVNLLHNSLNFTREIFIVSDLQSNVLRNLSRDSSKFAVDVSNFFMFPVGYDTDAGNQVNVSVDSVHLITQIFRSDSPVEAEAIIHNHSAQQV